MTHTFLIAVNKFQLRLKPSRQTILQTCRLSPSDGEISPFWFISSRLPVSANNLPVFEKFSDAPHQNSSSQIIRNTPTCFVFCDCLFKKFPLKEVFLSDIEHSRIQEIITYFQTARRQVNNNFFLAVLLSNKKIK